MCCGSPGVEVGGNVGASSAEPNDMYKYKDEYLDSIAIYTNKMRSNYTRSLGGGLI